MKLLAFLVFAPIVALVTMFTLTLFIWVVAVGCRRVGCRRGRRRSWAL